MTITIGNSLRSGLLICALICFLLATFGVSPPRVGLVALGLAFVTAAFLFTGG